MNVLNKDWSMFSRNKKKLADAESLIKAQQTRIAHLQALATTDDVTGLLNRRGFYMQFSAEMNLVNRGESEGGVMLLIEIENFDTIGREYGISATEGCLRLVGDCLRHNTRKSDWVARLNNDHFVAMFSGAKSVNAVERAQDLGQFLNTLRMRWNGRDVPLTLSISMKTYHRDSDALSLFDTTHNEDKASISDQVMVPAPALAEIASHSHFKNIYQ